MAEETDPKKARQAALNKAYGEASQMLRSKYQTEFNAFMKAAAQKVGIDWEPKKSKEEKAAEQLAALLTEFPHLATQVAPAEVAEPVKLAEPDGSLPAFKTGG